MNVNGVWLARKLVHQEVEHREPHVHINMMFDNLVVDIPVVFLVNKIVNK